MCKLYPFKGFVNYAQYNHEPTIRGVRINAQISEVKQPRPWLNLIWVTIKDPCILSFFITRNIKQKFSISVGISENVNCIHSWPIINIWNTVEMEGIWQPDMLPACITELCKTSNTRMNQKWSQSRWMLWLVFHKEIPFWLITLNHKHCYTVMFALNVLHQTLHFTLVHYTVLYSC